jgi:hypothetical protein
VTEKQVKNGLKTWHRWLGVVAALTGFLLERPEWLDEGPFAATALAVDPAQPGRYLRGGRWGVEESLDAGSTWLELPMLAPPENVRRIHFDSVDSGLVFALGPQSLVVSDDGGRVWDEIRFTDEALPPGTDLVDMATGPSGEWLVLTAGGLLISHDRGTTWKLPSEPAQPGTDWRGVVHDLHTGHMFGTVGRRLAEGTALAVVALTVSGLFIAFRRGRRRPR